MSLRHDEGQPLRRTATEALQGLFACLAASLLLTACGGTEPPTAPSSEPPAENVGAISSEAPVDPAEAAAGDPAGDIAGEAPADTVDDRSEADGPPPKLATGGGDMIRKKGGLEDQCLKAVAKEGVVVIGSNRIDESQAGIEIYVNVENAQAPWVCRYTRAGKLEGVEFSGSEGYM